MNCKDNKKYNKTLSVLMRIIGVILAIWTIPASVIILVGNSHVRPEPSPLLAIPLIAIGILGIVLFYHYNKSSKLNKVKDNEDPKNYCTSAKALMIPKCISALVGIFSGITAFSSFFEYVFGKTTRFNVDEFIMYSIIATLGVAIFIYIGKKQKIYRHNK